MGKKMLITCLVASLLGVGYLSVVRPRLPEWTLQFMVNQLERDDYAMIFESGLLEELEGFEAFGTPEEKEFLLRHLLDTLSYEILGSRIEGRTAFVQVDLTVIDLRELILENRQMIVRNAFSNLGGIFGNFMSGGMEQVIMQELIALLQDETVIIPLQTRKVEVLMERSGIMWEPLITEEWVVSALGLDEFELSLEDLLN